MPVITKSRFLELYGAIWNRVRQQVPRQGCHLIDHVLKLTCSYAQYRHSFAGKRTFSSHSKLTFRRAPHNIVSASSQTTQRHRKASLQLNCLWLKALRLPGPSQWCSFPSGSGLPTILFVIVNKGHLRLYRPNGQAKFHEPRKKAKRWSFHPGQMPTRA